MADIPLFRMSDMRLMPETPKVTWLPQREAQVVHLKRRGFAHSEIARIVHKSIDAVHGKVIELRKEGRLP